MRADRSYTPSRSFVYAPAPMLRDRPRSTLAGLVGQVVIAAMIAAFLCSI